MNNNQKGDSTDSFAIGARRAGDQVVGKDCST